MDTILEEIEAIKAIYCGEGEFEMHKATERDQVFTVSTKCGEEDGQDRVSVSITFSLTTDYPHSPPKLSFQSKYFTRSEGEALKSEILYFIKNLNGQPMLLDIITWVQDNGSAYRQKDADQVELKSSKEVNNLVTCLLHLGHMRAKVKYTKTIQKWTEELSLTGRLIFFEKLILIILQGRQNDVKEYIVRQKTVNVDVDSKGRSCKERMLSVVAEQELNEQKRFFDFTVVECSTGDELKFIFNSSNLEDLYLANVVPIFRR